MAESGFAYESCPLKHYVRVHGWLPACRRQLAAIRRQPKQRRLRYFTFCASGAVDVLMLNVARIIRLSDSGKFDTVVFFDKDEEAVNATYINIPGSRGFPADFADLVLAPDIGDVDALSSDTDKSDTSEVRQQKRLARQRNDFIQQFPFDIINLDLEEFLLKARDEFPGRILRSFMQILQWQKRPLPTGRTIDEFVLMYTTQIGPRELTDQYRELLDGAIADNLRNIPALEAVLHSRTGHNGPVSLRNADFDEFFRIAAPKLLAGYLRRADWLIDPEPGISVFEFDRPSARGPYKMLHFVMHVKRQHPPEIIRRPDQQGDGVPEAYSAVAHQLFAERETNVSLDNIDADGLLANLAQIFARRRKYASGS
jgi:hypothetical protein